jgi:hypothetical protein
MLAIVVADESREAMAAGDGRRFMAGSTPEEVAAAPGEVVDSTDRKEAKMCCRIRL